MQSVIVYRNPIEAAFWEGATSATFFPIICGIVVFFTVLLVLQMQVVERMKSQYRGVASYVNMGISAVAGIAVVYRMWL